MSNRTIYKYQVEFHRSSNPDFCAVYNYMDINQMFRDMLIGDLQYLIDLPDIEFLVSTGEFPSIWESLEDE